jgi:molybdopterin converting factor small subunit
MTNQELLAELESRFPGINDPDEEMDGGDTVDALVQWFAELGGTFLESTDDIESDDDLEEETEMERGRR